MSAPGFLCRTAATALPNDGRGGTARSGNQSAVRTLSSTGTTEVGRMTQQNQNPNQQDRKPGQQQQGGSQKPGQQQQDQKKSGQQGMEDQDQKDQRSGQR
jgi:hypothetical protein